MTINWSVIEASILKDVYDSGVQYEQLYQSRKIEDLKSNSSFSESLINEAIKRLEQKDLVKNLKGQYELIITTKGRAFVKDAILKSMR